MNKSKEKGTSKAGTDSNLRLHYITKEYRKEIFRLIPTLILVIFLVYCGSISRGYSAFGGEDVMLIAWICYAIYTLTRKEIKQ